jgi:hypothetical protein
MLKKGYVRDGKRRIIGSVTSGYSDESAVTRSAWRTTYTLSNWHCTPATR